MRLRWETGADWLEAVEADLVGFLQDHASCEKKASGQALSLAAHHPDRPELVGEMITLAREELDHYQQVFEHLASRGASIGRDERDPYVKKFLGVVRTDPHGYFLDRLLVFGVVEARGVERFRILAEGLSDSTLRNFYADLARSEAQHWALFVRMAKRYFPRDEVDSRLDELLSAEGEIVAALPLRSALH